MDDHGMREQDVIRQQPYRTSQLIYPGPKSKPDIFSQRTNYGAYGVKKWGVGSNDKSILLPLPQNQALVSKQQYNSPRNLYSNRALNEAIYVQTGVPIHRTPDKLPEFKPQNSPTFQAILEEEGPMTPMQPVKSTEHRAATKERGMQQNVSQLGTPFNHIAQSGSFKRLMYNVMYRGD